MTKKCDIQCLTLNTNSNHVKEKTTFKNAPTLAGENAQKVGSKIHENSEQFSQVNGLEHNFKKPNLPTQWVRVE